MSQWQIFTRCKTKERRTSGDLFGILKRDESPAFVHFKQLLYQKAIHPLFHSGFDPLSQLYTAHFPSVLFFPSHSHQELGGVFVAASHPSIFILCLLKWLIHFVTRIYSGEVKIRANARKKEQGVPRVSGFKTCLLSWIVLNSTSPVNAWKRKEQDLLVDIFRHPSVSFTFLQWNE